MRIGLIDVDGHNYPNLALMRISAYHKSRGDLVEWWFGWEHYDVVYMSKVFSNEYTGDEFEPANAEKVIKGGTGYAISLIDGKEVFNTETHKALPPEIERMSPDYSIYPRFDFAVAMTSRGCPRGCAFCHVAKKEGRCSVKVADVKDFWNGQKKIDVLDANITSCRDKRDLFRQYRETGAEINFNQGLDIRLLDDEDINDLNSMRIREIHFAWDDPKDDLEAAFVRYAEKAKHKPHGTYGAVYVLTNYNSSMQDNIYRIKTLRGLGYDPYVMIYDKTNAPHEIVRLQRWCNNKIIFKSCEWEDYKG